MDEMEVKLSGKLPKLRIWWLRVRAAAETHLPCMTPSDDIKLLRLLLARLERVSVDSYWAHRASGLRGSLLKNLEELEEGRSPGRVERNELISSAFTILTRAAREKR